MYSQSAFRWGDHVSKYAPVPTAQTQTELETMKIDESSELEQHSIWLRQYFRSDHAEYDFRVQLLQNMDEQSVEDIGKPWDEGKYPFETVGQVHLPKRQNSFDAKRRVFWEDWMKLNIWYGREAHRPLGSVNGLRKSVYQSSTKHREGMNATDVQAVSDIDQIP